MTIEEKDGIWIVVTEERLDALEAPKVKDAVKKLAEEGL